ncbi:alpha/beta hydrolase [Rugosimonospora acidiphila]|uniref:Alpha/beta hydrolase n=1 Tax=Rugosimonospora acidiphila TaxID=556531 RepID=A0ABP9SIV8_9ACTN
MATFPALDGTLLAYDRVGEDGDPLICLPGGPLLPPEYLGDLGGLAAYRSLVLPHLRGTGKSAVPADPTSCRCDRLVDDVEALRAHLGLGRVDLLGHSAGGSLAALYTLRYPDRVGRLVLACSSPRVVGLPISDDDRRQVIEPRRGEPWFPDAYAAFGRVWSGDPTDADWQALTPFTYGRWDAAARAHAAGMDAARNDAVAAQYYSEGALDPPATRAALAGLAVPVLLVAGEYDPSLPPHRAAEYVGMFGRAELAVLPGGGHYPWLDDAQWWVRTLTGFLD